MQYSDFYELKEIGSGGYGTVYTARYKGEVKYISQMLHSNGLRVLMKTPELFNKYFFLFYSSEIMQSVRSTFCCRSVTFVLHLPPVKTDGLIVPCMSKNGHFYCRYQIHYLKISIIHLTFRLYSTCLFQIIPESVILSRCFDRAMKLFQ